MNILSKKYEQYKDNPGTVGHAKYERRKAAEDLLPAGAIALGSLAVAAGAAISGGDVLQSQSPAPETKQIDVSYEDLSPAQPVRVEGTDLMQKHGPGVYDNLEHAREVANDINEANGFVESPAANEVPASTITGDAANTFILPELNNNSEK